MKLADIFSDNMVFQAGKPVRFFGTGKGEIAVTLGGETHRKEIPDENWVFELPARPYCDSCNILIRTGEEEIQLRNVAFGDVFLCAGQSNMQFEAREEKGASAAEDDDGIRYFVTDRIEEYSGVKSADGWKLCKKGEVGNWSALGLHIAQKYRKERGVPVGIVGCFQGASAIRSWLPESALDESVFVPLKERHADSRDPVFSVWNGDCDLYRRTFLPIVPFSFQGAVWYQGESDTAAAESKVYTELLARLISSWRHDLRDDELPFVVVEICDYDLRDDRDWHAIQRCQQQAANRVKGVTVVTSKDVCEHGNIHPSNKEKLAEKIVRVL